ALHNRRAVRVASGWLSAPLGSAVMPAGASASPWGWATMPGRQAGIPVPMGTHCATPPTIPPHGPLVSLSLFPYLSLFLSPSLSPSPFPPSSPLSNYLSHFLCWWRLTRRLGSSTHC